MSKYLYDFFFVQPCLFWKWEHFYDDLPLPFLYSAHRHKKTNEWVISYFENDYIPTLGNYPVFKNNQFSGSMVTSTLERWYSNERRK